MRIFSRRRDAEWRRDVLARLDALAESQRELRQETGQIGGVAESQRQLREQLAGHIEEGRLTPGRVWRVAVWAAVILGLIIMSVAGLTVASTYQNEQTSAISEEGAVLAQTNTAIAPIERAVARHGARYVVDHATKAYVADAQKAANLSRQYAQDRTEADHFTFDWITSFEISETVLTICSAALGALASWLIIPALVRRREGH